MSNNATVSVASSTALVDTNRGCTTSSSKMFEINPYVTATFLSVHVSRNLITSTHRPYIDPCILFAKRMSVSQLRNDRNWVQSRVLRECRGDDLKRVGVRLEAIRFHTLECLCMVGEHA